MLGTGRQARSICFVDDLVDGLLLLDLRPSPINVTEPEVTMRDLADTIVPTGSSSRSCSCRDRLTTRSAAAPI